MENLGSQFKNCSNLTLDRIERANLISVVFSTVTFLILLVFIAFLVLYRAFKTTLQRLFLYLTIATALDVMVTIFDVELRFDVDPRFCAWIGFGDVWTSNSIELFNLAFTLYLIVTAYEKLRGRKVRCFEGCRQHPLLTEAACVFVLIFLPLGYLWLPMVHDTYGLGNSVCWIKKYDENCSTVNHSKSDSTIIEAVGIGIHFAVIVSFLTLMVTLTMLVVKLRGSKERNLLKAIFLIVMLGLSLSFRVAQFGMNIAIDFYHVMVNEYAHDAINNIGYTISYFVVPLGFAVYLYSPKKLTFKALKKAARKWVCCRHCHTHHSSRMKEKQARSDPVKSGIIDEDGQGSVESSVERAVPSHTTGYSSPYTNEFTNITEIVSTSTTKYGTIQT